MAPISKPKDYNVITHFSLRQMLMTNSSYAYGWNLLKLLAAETTNRTNTQYHPTRVMSEIDET